MNIQTGLERLSLAWWGFWIVVCGVLLLAALVGLWNGRDDNLVLIALTVTGAVASFGAHKVTCWVIRGFFAPR